MGRGGCKAAGMTAYDRGGGSSRSDAAGRLEAARYRKGEIPVDWIIGFVIFMLFLSWSFQYYSTFFRARGMPLDQVALGINTILMGNITISVYDTPVIYESPDATSSVMYAYYNWKSDDEKRTTMVFDGSSMQVTCKIDGDILYWNDDVIGGQNNFTIRVSNRTEAVMNCSGSFEVANANQTIPRAGDLRLMLSQDAIDSMVASNYDYFKDVNGINRDFRIRIETAGGTTTYGSVPPNASNVFSEEQWLKIEKTSRDARVTTLIW